MSSVLDSTNIACFAPLSYNYWKPRASNCISVKCQTPSFSTDLYMLLGPVHYIYLNKQERFCNCGFGRE